MNSKFTERRIIMKKKFLTMLLVLAVGAGVMVGCTKSSAQEAKDAENFGIDVQQSEVIQEETKEVKGVVEEIKDFMVIVTDSDNVSYAFTYDEKPEGLKEVSIGDTVIVKYTGTISEVDPFMGEVLSVEKQ